MKTKYFTSSEQAALKVFNNLNALVKKGEITIFGPCFTHCQKIFVGRVVKDKDRDWLNRIAITFVEKHHLNFAVKVVLTAVNTCFDKKDKTNTWLPEKIVIGKLGFYSDLGDNWKVVKQENVRYSPNPLQPKKCPGPTLETFTSLTDFISSI